MLVSPYHLSLWEVAHRWHNKHPNQTDPAVIPLDVLDTLRWLAEQSLRHEVTLCNENGIERMNANDAPSYSEFEMDGDEYTEEEKVAAYIAHKNALHDLHEALIVGFEPCPLKRECPKEIFDNVYITRHSLQELCEVHNVEPPSFWPQETLESGKAKEEASPKKLSPSAQDKSLVHAVAKTLWDEHPKMTIADMLTHKAILTYAGGKNYSAEKTLRRWLSEVDPRTQAEKTGRPRKTVGTSS